MARCYVKIKGEVINPKIVTTSKGTKLNTFAIKIDTKDYKSGEWNTLFMNATLISDTVELKNKTLYEFDGSLDVEVYTKQNNEVVKNIVLTAFEATEMNGKNGNKDIEPPVKEAKEVRRSLSDTIKEVFTYEEDEDAPF